MISEEIRRRVEEADWFGDLTDEEKIDVIDSTIRLGQLVLAFEVAKDDDERSSVKREMKTVADTISLAGKAVGLRTMNKVRGVLSSVLIDSRQIAVMALGAM